MSLVLMTLSTKCYLFNKYGAIFSYLYKILLFFYTDYEKYAIVEISTEKKIICDTESINMWI